MAMQPKTWVKKATQKKSKVKSPDERLLQVHGDPAGKTVATDRNRMHIYNGDLGFDPVEDYVDWRAVFDKVSYKIEGILTHVHLMHIAQAAKAYITKDQPVWMALEFHPDVLTATYKGEDGNGSCTLRTGAEWTGYEPLHAEFKCNGLATISINPLFLLDALKGFAPKFSNTQFMISEDLSFILFKRMAYTAFIATAAGVK